MITTPRTVRVWAYGAPADLRKGYNGLWGLVRNELGRDPLSGDLFLFVNRRRRGCKVLLWDGTGLCIFMKRLERGQFAELWTGDARRPVQLTASELSLFVEGCTLVGKHALSPPAVE
jgi:transposase